MTRRLRSLAWILSFGILLSVPAVSHAQSRKDFKIPEGANKVAEYLPWGGQYIPDEIYEKWWVEIAACEQLPLPPVHYLVRFYQINAIHFYDALRPSLGLDLFGNLVIRWAVGMSYPEDLEMYVALPSREVEIVLKHEMIHFLMFWAGEPGGHPPERFETCGVTTIYNEPG